MNNLLPTATGEVLNFMNERVRFGIEDSNFFETSFLARKASFLATLLQHVWRCWHERVVAELLHLDAAAPAARTTGQRLADQIMVKIADQVSSFDAVSPGAGGHHPAHRLLLRPAGRYPRCPHQGWRRACKSLRPFATLACTASSTVASPDIFPAELTAERNPDAVVDVVKAAFSIDDRYLSFYRSG